MKKKIIAGTGLVIAIAVFLLLFPEVLSGLYWKCNSVRVGMTREQVMERMGPYQNGENFYAERSLPAGPGGENAYVWGFAISPYVCEIGFVNDVVSRIDGGLRLAGKFDF